MLNDPVYLVKLADWNTAQGELLAATTKERRLRAELFAGAFPAPVEGSQYADLPNGWRIKGEVKMSYKVDEAALPAALETVRAIGTNPDPAIRYKPELAMRAYKQLPEQARKLLGVALTIKPGLPTIELIPPKQPDPLK